MSEDGALFVLHETAAGYGLFEVVSFEEIGALLEGTAENATDLERFSRCVTLTAFRPFATASEALENANAVSEHAVTAELKDFLRAHLPTRNGKTTLGVVDAALATAVAEVLPGGDDGNASVRSDDTVREIVRGVRAHLPRYVKGLEGGAAKQAQLGLGHSYSRAKVKFNPARSDNMIIQSIALLDQMDKDLNTFAMRIREWYSWHFPELKDLVKDNYMFARCAALVQDRATLFKSSKEGNDSDEDDDSDDDDDDDANERPKEKKEDTVEAKRAGLVEIVGDPAVADAVVAAARTSMGTDCSVVDMVNIVNFSRRMVDLAEYRKRLAGYLSDKMSAVAPNLSAILGDAVAARLISKAGSLTNLAKAPASTVQILGAEKALFRALKTKGNTPKYGLIYHSTFIGRADAKNKGRISRYLANKCSIATRIDSFADDPCNAYGVKLREQVEERLRFYETGANPRKNVDVMKEVARHLAAANNDDDVDMDDADDEEERKEKKKSKKSKKKRKSDASMEDAEKEKDEGEENKKEKKSAKKARRESLRTDDDDDDEPRSHKKKKKSKKAKDDDDADGSTPAKKAETPSSEKKSSKKEKKSAKKKKKSKS